MKKICLVSPNYVIRDEFGDPTDPPIGIASIASVLEHQGYKVKILDANALNLTTQETANEIVSFSPDVVGVSCNYSPLHNPTLNLTNLLKNLLGNRVKIIVGGNHATAMAEYILKTSCGSIDFIVVGEGEVSFLNLLKAIEGNTDTSKVKGIAFQKDERIIFTQPQSLINDLNQLKIPAYHLLPIEKYIRYNIVSSRGCPYNCSFCASDVVFGHKVRWRSPKVVVDEIEYLLNKYGAKHFWFSDDTFTANLKYAENISEELMKRNLNITWSCLTRVNVINLEILNKMKKAGCVYISYGIESGNPDMLKKIGKNISIDTIKETVDLTHKADIRQYGFFILGFPGENHKTLEDTFKLVSELKLDGAAFNIFIPLPGSSLMNYLLKNKFITLDEIKWDYLFARSVKGGYIDYSAQLASRWCELSQEELISACEHGTKLAQKENHEDISYRM